ncbi:MAG: hypothetical protein BM485_13770 [Desulfobulbaceae bacterium DB1]|nr:MAG: hypothetical protein BM485_13770 [Desulfobulbaceae bacterium DB1]
MKRIFTKKFLLMTSITAGLLLATPSLSPAFKGMGAPEGGSGMTSPHGGESDTLDPALMGHQGNTNIIVANVNGREITMGELMQSIMTLMTRGGYGGREMSAEMSRKLRYDALQELAMEELAYQKGISLGITADPAAVQKHLDAKISAAGGRESFDKSLAEQKKTIADVTNEISRFLVVREAINQDVYRKAMVSPEEVDKVYNANKAQFTAPEQVTITDVIFFLDPNDPAAVKKVEETAKKITEEHNNTPSGLAPDGFVVESGVSVSPQDRAGLYEAARKMQPGTLSGPLVIDGTLHLIKLDHYQPAVETPADQAKSAISAQLKRNKRQEMLTEWRNNLVKSADIKITHELLKDEGK